MLSCNGLLKRREGGAYIEFDVEAPCSASCKRRAVSGESLILCYPSELGGTGVLESTAFSGLLKRLASGFVLSTLRQKKLIVYFHNRRCSARAYLDSRLSYCFALTCFS
jgi:hypothetical protein